MKEKTKKKILFATCLIIVLLIIFAVYIVFFNNNNSSKPYSQIQNQDIAGVTLECIHGASSEYVLTEEQIQSFIDILKDVEIYEKTDEWREVSGGQDIFTITKTDNTKEEIALVNPWIVINQQGYTYDEDDSEELQELIEEIVNHVK